MGKEVVDFTYILPDHPALAYVGRGWKKNWKLISCNGRP
jgi:hypothetical protein